MDEYSIVCMINCVYANLLSNNLKNQFIQLTTHEERFIFVLETVVQSSEVSFDFERIKEHSEHSKKLRENGNTSYMSSQYYKALQEYTESIVYAPNTSEELALAYANRSAALFKLEKYEDCIKDIDRALNLKYPDRLKVKLYNRKGLCLISLDRPDAESSFEEALLWLDKMNISEDERIRSKAEVKNLMATSHSVAKLPQNAMKNTSREMLTPNPEIPSASDAVTIKYSEKFGRHVVATRKIKPGEILVIEKPYCKRLIPKYVYTNCSHCFNASWAMIPCNNCVNVAYCSETCKDKAWDEYHEVECPVVGQLLSLHVDEPTCLSMRMAVMATKKGMKLDELRRELIIVEQNTDPCRSLYSDDGKLHSDQYRSIHCSRVNEDDETSIEQLILSALWVALTVCILARESEMFGKKLTLDTLAKNSDVTFVGGLMYKHLRLGAQIKTVKIGSHHGPSDPIVYGHGLMAISTLFNHSCDANTTKISVLGRMVTYAIYPIEEGEQLFANYGPDFTSMPRAQRQERFKKWKFNCDCLPCREDWPLAHAIPSYTEQKMNPQAKKKLDKVVQKLKKYDSLVQKNTTEAESNVLNAMFDLIEILFTSARKPCRELMLANNLLKVFYADKELMTLNFEPISPSDITMQDLFPRFIKFFLSRF